MQKKQPKNAKEAGGIKNRKASTISQKLSNPNTKNQTNNQEAWILQIESWNAKAKTKSQLRRAKYNSGEQKQEEQK